MGESWIVSNLNAALSTWNDKLGEIWSLLTESPQTFKGGQVWGVMTGIHGALQAIGYGLLVLFFAVTDFVLEHCTEDQTVYINMDSNGYSGTTFAYSDPAHPQLQTMILWESSVPSTHGFPTGIWTSEYVMVTDRVDEGGIVGPINAALRTQSPAAVHYEYVTEFPLDGITLYCYRRTARPDAEEADYFKQVFAEYDARWPEIFSQRIDEYMQSVQ